MGETRGAHSIDIAGNSGGESFKPCIFKVPNTLRRHNPKSFTPNSFSFGPIHYKKKYMKEQKKAEIIKQHYLNNLLTRKPTPQTTREDFKRSILEVEEKVRQCYDVPFDHISKDEFVDMLVLDGCFIIEFLRNIEVVQMKNVDDNNNNTIDEDDPVVCVSWVQQVLYHDLILLENQIPWFVLVRLFDMTSPTISGVTESLTQLALHFFGIIFQNQPHPKIKGTRKSNHILDFIRNVLVSSQESTEKSNQQLDRRNALQTAKTKKEKTSIGEWVRGFQLLPAARLKELGIWFKTDESSNLLNITFAFKHGVFASNHGVLKIPYLVIGSVPCTTLRNLISYEQCYPNCEARVTSYAIFFKNLITTPSDIEVLHEAGIVDSFMNPSDALEFFKDVPLDTSMNDFYYGQICRQVNEYTDQFWPRYMATYMRMFRDPTGFVSLSLTVYALLFTVVQTCYTVMQYNKDSSPSPSPS